MKYKIVFSKIEGLPHHFELLENGDIIFDVNITITEILEKKFFKNKTIYKLEDNIENKKYINLESNVFFNEKGQIRTETKIKEKGMDIFDLKEQILEEGEKITFNYIKEIEQILYDLLKRRKTFKLDYYDFFKKNIIKNPNDNNMSHYKFEKTNGESLTFFYTGRNKIILQTSIYSEKGEIRFTKGISDIEKFFSSSEKHRLKLLF